MAQHMLLIFHPPIQGAQSPPPPPPQPLHPNPHQQFYPKDPSNKVQIPFRQVEIMLVWSVMARTGGAEI